MSAKTIAQYDEQLGKCREIYLKKTKDYGTAWRILRPSSLTDQLYIKAKRNRSIEEKGEQKVDEGIENEFIGLVNYSIMALVQLEMSADAEIEFSEAEAARHYDNYSEKTKALMLAKNHDYGEAWREMRISSLTDLILMKLLRIKQIEDNKGKTLISEGFDAGYQDIINYSLFALIRINE